MGTVMGGDAGLDFFLFEIEAPSSSWRRRLLTVVAGIAVEMPPGWEMQDRGRGREEDRNEELCLRTCSQQILKGASCGWSREVALVKLVVFLAEEKGSNMESLVMVEGQHSRFWKPRRFLTRRFGRIHSRICLNCSL